MIRPPDGSARSSAGHVEAFGDAPRALLEFTLDLFSPTALISGQEGGRPCSPSAGAMIEPASPIGRVVAKGTVFQPLRLVSDKTEASWSGPSP